MTYRINYAYTCHAGKVRSNNEDNFWCCGEILPSQNLGMQEVCGGERLRESFPVLIVFDGMGGESQGEMAAYLASQEFGKYYGQNKGKLRRQPENFLLEACQIMNQAVCSYSASNRINAMGTTMAMIVFARKSVYICNLGDSRIYQQSQGQIRQISSDHVLRSYMFGKAPLTQFLGVEESEMKLEPSVKALEYQEGDRYLLCSDGVTDMLSDKEIETAMASGESVGDTVQILMDQVLEKGARDNTTIILCEIQRENHPLRAWLRQNKKENEGDVL